MPLPLIGAVVAAATSVAGRWSIGAAVAFGVVAGVLRVITLLGIAVVAYQGLEGLQPYIVDMLSTASGSVSTGGVSQFGQLLTILKITEAFALLTSAVLTRITYSLGLSLGIRGQGA